MFCLRNGVSLTLKILSTYRASSITPVFVELLTGGSAVSIVMHLQHCHRTGNKKRQDTSIIKALTHMQTLVVEDKNWELLKRLKPEEYG